MKQLWNLTTGEVVAERVRIAASPLDRLIGFINRRHIDARDALWFPRCSSIHTLGMKVPIDVVFLDEDDCVLRLIYAVPKNCPAIVCPGARTAVELGRGALERCDILLSDRFALR